jgi:hypothetical protein
MRETTFGKMFQASRILIFREPIADCLITGADMVSTPRHKGKDMFPYIGPESSITLTRNSVDDPLVVTAAGWTYELREDDFDIGFEIAIVDPEGRHTATG